MMSSKKPSLGWLGVLALLATLVLAACGDATTTVAPAVTNTVAGGAKPTVMNTAASAGTTPMTGGDMVPNMAVSGNVRISIAPSSPAEDTIVDQQLANFAKAYPNVKVQKEIIASDYDTKIKTLLAGNNPPDVFYVDSLIALDYIEDKALAPLDDLAGKMNVKFDDFYPALIKAYTGADGKVYGLPKDHNTLVMFYNKEMFQQAGITSPPKTWDELRTAAVALKAKLPADAVPIAAEPDLARALAFIYQAGGLMVSDDRKSSKVSDAGFKKGLEYYSNLRKDGLSKKSSELGAEWPGDALVKGKAAIAMEGGWLIPFADKTTLKGKYGIAELPKGDQAGTLDFTVAYVVSNKSQNKEAAFALTSFLTSENQQRLLTDAGLALPSRKALTASFVEKFPDRKPLVDAVQYARAWQFGVGFGGFADKANPLLQGLFSGNKQLNDVITEIDKLVKDRL